MRIADRRGRWATAAAVTAAMLSVASPPLPAGGAHGDAVPGASVGELLVLARQMNPGVAAAALESEAALARADAAGRLPDPTFATEFKDLTRQRNSAVPDELGRVDYRIQQDFPLWGKLGLQEDVARARAAASRESQRASEAELAARIKTVFARYFAAFEGWRLTGEVHRTVAILTDVTHGRYAQGLAPQADVSRAETQKIRLGTELVRLEVRQRQAAAQLNALLGRPAAAALAAPAALRPLPDPLPSLSELLERARAGNPDVGALQSGITAAEGDRTLVSRSWYPDVTLGVTFQQFVDQDGRSPGYEAMIGVQLPLQWGLREAWEREAAANVAAAQRRRDAADAGVQGDLANAYWALDGSGRIAALLREEQVPQVRLAASTALRGYEQGRGDLATVLEAEQQVFETMLRLLDEQVEQQALLAEIERLIGSDL